MTSLIDALFGGWNKGESRSLTSAATKDKEAVDANRSPSDILPGAALATVEPSAAEHNISILSLEPQDVLPVVMSPIRSGRADSSYSSSDMDTSASLSTPGVDISFGPQSLPFAARRRRPYEAESPSRVPNNTPQSIAGNRPRSVAVTIRHPDASIEEVDEIIGSGEPVTAWRIEQLKYMRKARMSRDDTVKPIPTLNGPLSLPYARNPSGVDATVPDDSLTYLTHVFGLRGDSQVKLHPTESFRVASNGSTKVGDTDAAAENTKETSKVGQARPLVVREPHQLLGLRKIAAVKIEDPKVKDVIEKAKIFPHAVLSETTAAAIVPESKDSQTYASVPASAILRAQAKPTHTPPAPVITSSPPKPIDPFNGLFDQALTNAARHYPVASDNSCSRQVSDPIKPTYADLKSIWQASGQFYGRIAAAEDDKVGTPARRVVSDDTTNTSFGAAEFSTPIKIPSTPSALCKADKSANWRNKPVTTPGGREIPSIALISPTKEPNATVMTIDALFDKFHVVDQKPSSSSAPAGEVTDPAIKDTSSTPMKAKPTKGPLSIRGPLGESKGIAVNAAPMKATAASHKGTPNAGKLLKKKVAISVPKDVPAKSKGKAKATD